MAKSNLKTSNEWITTVISDLVQTFSFVENSDLNLVL